MKPEIECLKRMRDIAIQFFNEAVIENQLACNHKNLAECDYYKIAEWLDAHPPIRICLDCCLTEEGWGCGYIVLTGKAGSIDRDDLFKKRLGKMIMDRDKGHLLRKEVTLSELIKGKILLT